jgi:hypothetical protein
LSAEYDVRLPPQLFGAVLLSACNKPTDVKTALDTQAVKFATPNFVPVPAYPDRGSVEMPMSLINPTSTIFEIMTIHTQILQGSDLACEDEADFSRTVPRNGKVRVKLVVGCRRDNIEPTFDSITTITIRTATDDPFDLQFKRTGLVATEL